MNPALLQQLRSAVDPVMAERIMHHPLDAGQPDPVRAVSQLEAVLRTGDRTPVQPRLGRDGGAGFQVAESGGELRVDREVYPAVLLREGDKIRAVSRDGAPWFEILHVDDRSHLRLICHLGDA